MQLPNWMMEEPQPHTIIEPSVKGKRSNFLIKSIRRMRAVICEDMQTERYARQEGLLQRVRPDTKLIVMLALIVGASITRSIPLLLALWVGTIILMYLSHLPVLVLQKRIWGFIPLITLLFTLPVVLNIFVDGEPLFMIYQWGEAHRWMGITWPPALFVTRQGVIAVFLLFLRVGISLSMGVILLMTTPAADIFKSLRVLRIPPFFIMIIEMTYRYLFVLLTVSLEMFEARRLRTVGKMPVSRQRAQVGTSIAALFARSMNLSEEVYQAMLARCYTGEVPDSFPEPGGIPNLPAADADCRNRI
ncbi:MAG: cobalt ECF transporter T component CbiQ [Bacillota bacterium]